MEQVSEGRKDDTGEFQMEQMTPVEGLPDAKQLREEDGGVNSSNKQTEEKQEAKESVERDTLADTTRDSMMVDGTSQANPRDEEVEGKWGQRERNGRGMKESRSGVRSNAKAKGGTGNTHELWSEDKDIELQV
jgi:hypothetical protein